MAGSVKISDAVTETALKGELADLYRTLKADEKPLFLSALRRSVYKKGELIHAHAGACLGILFLEKGRACATMLSDEGRDAVLFRVKENDCCILSAACIMRQVRFDVHIEAERDATLLIVPAQTVEQLMQGNAEFRSELYRLAAVRFSNVLQNLQELLFGRLERRIARFLLEEAQLCGSDTLHLTHEAAARYVGSAREVVTRNLTKLAKEGIVSLDRGKITLLDKAALKNLL